MKEAVTTGEPPSRGSPSAGSSARSSCDEGRASNISSNILGVTGWHPTGRAGLAPDKTAGQGTC